MAWVKIDDPLSVDMIERCPIAVAVSSSPCSAAWSAIKSGLYASTEL